MLQKLKQLYMDILIDNTRSRVESSIKQNHLYSNHNIVSLPHLNMKHTNEKLISTIYENDKNVSVLFSFTSENKELLDIKNTKFTITQLSLDLTDIYLQKDGLTFKLWNIEDGIGGYPKTSPFLDSTNYNTEPLFQVKLIDNPIPKQYEHLTPNLKFVKISRIDIVDKDWELEGIKPFRHVEDLRYTVLTGTDRFIHIYYDFTGFEEAQIQYDNQQFVKKCQQEKDQREQRIRQDILNLVEGKNNK